VLTDIGKQVLTAGLIIALVLFLSFAW